MSKRGARPAAACLFAILAATLAHAHAMRLTVRVEGAAIVGAARIDPDMPVAAQRVRLLSTAGDAIAETTTDGEGRFRLVAPVRADFEVECVTQDGHRAVAPVRAEALPEALPTPHAGFGVPAGPPADTSVLESAVSRQLQPVLDKLAALEQRARFRDVLGGIGYIVGIAGLVLWIRARSRP